MSVPFIWVLFDFFQQYFVVFSIEVLCVFVRFTLTTKYLFLSDCICHCIFNFCFYMLVYVSMEIQLLFVFLFFILHAYWTHSLVLKIFSRFLGILLLRPSICIILPFLMFQDSLFCDFHYAQITFLSYSLRFAGEKFC